MALLHVSLAFAWLSLLLPLINGQDQLDNVQVTTRQGVLTGTYYPVLSRTEFRSIPYSLPPTNNLRWKAPVYPPSNYTNGTRDATGSVPLVCCTQATTDFFPSSKCPGGISEDCLYLNMFIPGRLNATAKLPVMVWIHGGGFTWGSSTLYNTTLLTSSYNVIGVAVNYRLNIFGFFASPELMDEAGSSGLNFGIQDTAAALRWVKDNIAAFGGDPDSITVFGQSAGAIDIAWLLSNPKYEGLFSKAILESGASASIPVEKPGSVYSVGNFNRALKTFNISTTASPKAKLAALRKVSTSDLIQFFGPTTAASAIAPVVDKAIILDTPLRVLATGKIVKRLKGIVLGTTTNEGSLFALFQNQTTAASLRSLLSVQESTVPELSRQVSGGNWSQIVRDLYLGNASGNFSREFEANSDYLTDSSFSVPVRKLAQAYVAAGVPVYKYRFDIVTQSTLQAYGALFNAGINMGVVHGSEILHVFSAIPPSIPGEFQTSLQMASSWTEFARVGVPSNPVLGTWPTYTVPQRQVMYFGPNGTAVAKPEGDLPDFRKEGQAYIEEYLEVSNNVPRPPISRNGRCGPRFGTRCPSDVQCCSLYGWCGSGPALSGTGCQIDWSYVSVSCG